MKIQVNQKCVDVPHTVTGDQAIVRRRRNLGCEVEGLADVARCLHLHVPGGGWLQPGERSWARGARRARWFDVTNEGPGRDLA